MTARLSPAYLIVGDDVWLAERALAEIVASVDEVSVEEFGPADDHSDALQALGTSSIFGGQRVVVVRDAHQFPAEFHRRLVSYLEEPNPSTVLVVIAERAPPGLGPAVKKVGRQINAVKGRRSDLFSWVRDEAGSRGLKVTGETMTALVESVGEDRMALAQALDELALAIGEGRVAASDVRRQFRSRADVKVFGFVDAVAGRQAGPALEALHRLLRQGEAPQLLFWTLARHVRLLLVAGDRGPSEISDLMQIPGWRAEKLARQATNFTSGELARAYRLLAEADRKMKRSEEPEELTLERAVVGIASPS
jgi:DNA polymerase-3 subunit delta